MRFYLDTSAYLCILLGEDGHEQLMTELHGGELMSSSILGLEAYRNLVRLGRQATLSAEDLQTALRRGNTDLGVSVSVRHDRRHPQ